MINQKVLKIKRFLRRNNYDAFLVSSPENVSYISGFTGGDCRLLITRRENIFIGDFRYKLQAKKELDDDSFCIEMLSSSIFTLLKDLLKKHNISSLCFESQYTSVAFYNQLTKHLKRIKLIPTKETIEQQRIIKTPKELQNIQKAVNITKKGFKKLKTLIRPGITELWLKHKLEEILKSYGADGLSFDIIVASGLNAAMPHAKTTNKKIQKNEPIIVDAGANYKGYKSDLTRTFFLGKMTQYAHYYKLVATAQDRAIKIVAPGVKISTVDSRARAVFKKDNLQDFFGHALGHGVGLNIHEAPTISQLNKQKLKSGMVFTVEPGLYMPEWGGIRIEDMVTVTEKGYRVL
ncbi:MAG: aminopeptidase P family protein [PVC group bacterium]|nr:aminopeptidase P family protein [PVC group bacterium]